MSKKLQKDPVCGMAVEEGPEAITAELRGATYFFCSDGCRLEFLAPEREIRRTRILVAVGAVISAAILLLTYLPLMPRTQADPLMLLLALPVQFWAGGRFYRGAWHALRAGVSNMDLLVAVGTSAAFAYSAVVALAPGYFGVQGVYFDAAAVITTLVLLGKLLEHTTKERASQSIRKLMELAPRTAHVLDGESSVDVPVERLAPGNVFEVKPGERIPTDGVVVRGDSEVDESLVTGESTPARKRVGSQVIGGSMNAGGRLVARATAVGSDTVLGQITRMVEDARIGRAPVQRLADRVTRYFVPAVVGLAVAASAFWLLVGHVSSSTSLLIFVSVTIIACPCALGIATPAALLVGTGNAAKKGILMKGGESVEAAARVDTVVLDKTGTVTKGRQSVVSILGRDPEKVLLMAATVESASEHRLGASIVENARERGLRLLEVSDFQAAPGRGAGGVVEGMKVRVGRRDFVGIPARWEFDENVDSLRRGGMTIVFVAAGAELGAIALGDELKDDASRAVNEIRSMGMSVLMLTGDEETTAREVATKIGISDVRARLLPGDKEEVVSSLEREGRTVAMVGDGINDAPALAKADLGIAIGSGTDVAKETGGVVLVGDMLMGVVWTIRIGRATLRKIKQNLAWALVYNAVLIPVAAGALIPIYGVGVYSVLPFLSGVAMACSSASVVANSLLLSRIRL